MLQSPTGSSWMRASPLEILITRACEPSLHEPNYALHLEVAEYINQKKANTPREAAMTLARLANHRNPHIAILALSLLDTLVQSCGYPFHLQIATKEFLNELVRRFPERPPPFPGPVMSRILELIHGWKEGICSESRWKEDLGNIRDMHRLLTFKGYRFRDAPRTTSVAASAAAVRANLKSAIELENEDREAQSAKLQELIRRGTPRDLAAAQELMKSLAGANPDAQPDYREQSLTELNKLETKVVLMNEMLDNVDTQRGERFVAGDAYDQVATILVAARPKLQTWISDAETDDPESLDTFLQINDQINTVLDRYEAFKKGDYTFAANPIPKELGNDAAATSLIDFEEPVGTSSAPGSNTAANDLASLFAAPAVPIQSNIQVPGFGGMQPGFGMGAPQPPQFFQQQQQPMQQGFLQTHAPTPMFSGMQAGLTSPLNTMGGRQTASPPASIALPGTPVGGASAARGATPLQQQPQIPGMFGNGMQATNGGAGMSGFNGMGMGFGGAQAPSLMWGSSPQPMMGQPMQPQQQQRPQQQQSTPQTTTNQNQAKDPFADLAGLF
ncbi:VHS domain-containing protein [Panaeolus papilionaceus]|nr:VHS domain-containing protein [Panaeolus papilionaceus]